MELIVKFKYSLNIDMWSIYNRDKESPLYESWWIQFTCSDSCQQLLFNYIQTLLDLDLIYFFYLLCDMTDSVE